MSNTDIRDTLAVLTNPTHAEVNELYIPSSEDSLRAKEAYEEARDRLFESDPQNSHREADDADASWLDLCEMVLELGRFGDEDATLSDISEEEARELDAM